MISCRTARPPKDKIEALSTARVEVVRNVMVEELQVRPGQVIVAEDLDGGLVDGGPVVQAELGVVEEEEEELDEEDPFEDD